MYRVYMVYNTPLEGCEDFFDVRTKKMAIKLTKYLNNKTNNWWVWA